jgi:hypothetical protein
MARARALEKVHRRRWLYCYRTLMAKLCPEPYFISAKLVQVDVSKYYDKWKAKANNRDTKDPLMYYQRSIAELAYIAMNCCGSNTTQMANSCPKLSDNKKKV